MLQSIVFCVILIFFWKCYMKRCSPHDADTSNEVDTTTMLPLPFDAFASDHGSIDGTTPRKLTLVSPDANSIKKQSPFFSSRDYSSNNTGSKLTNSGLKTTKSLQSNIGDANLEQPNFPTDNTTTPTATPTETLKENVGDKVLKMTPISSCVLNKKEEGSPNLQGDSTQFASLGGILPIDWTLSNQT